MIGTTLGQQGFELLEDGLDEVRWECGHGFSPSSGSLEDSPDDRASRVRFPSSGPSHLSAQALSDFRVIQGDYTQVRDGVLAFSAHLIVNPAAGSVAALRGSLTELAHERGSRLRVLEPGQDARLAALAAADDGAAHHATPGGTAGRRRRRGSLQ